MFLDASIIVAVLAREIDADSIAQILGSATGSFYTSAFVRYEATLGLAQAKTRLSSKAIKPNAEMLNLARRSVNTLLDDIKAQDIEIDYNIGQMAIDAAARFGKAVGHKADLNFGDCFAYACAKSSHLRLLFKGNDFVHTDVNDGIA